MTKEYSFLDHKATFLQIQDQVGLLTMLKNMGYVMQTKIETIPEDWEIINKHLQNIPHHIREYRHHTTLKTR